LDRVAGSSPEDRADLFNETGAKIRLTPELVEKDFWVCWCLGKLFVPKLADLGLLFKGGTSLSKVFNAIVRFSQDIDLSIDRAKLGFADKKDPLNMESKNQRRKVLPLLEEAMQAGVRDTLLPVVQADFTNVLKPRGEAWKLDLRIVGSETEIAFQYPAAIRASSGSFRPEVLMQFGARSGRYPTLEGCVSPYAAQSFPEQFQTRFSIVPTLGIERTVWEKIVLVHGLRLKAMPKVESMSRHYSDLASLAEREDCQRAVDDDDMLKSTVEYQHRLYEVSNAACESMKRGSFRLEPDGELLKALEADYNKHADIYFGQVAPFDEIMRKVKLLEDRVNRASAA